MDMLDSEMIIIDEGNLDIHATCMVNSCQGRLWGFFLQNYLIYQHGKHNFLHV